MPNTLVECVPNFSEGRDAAKVDAIVEAMKIPGVYLLDREMDADHNRWSSRWSASARPFRKPPFAASARPPS